MVIAENAVQAGKLSAGDLPAVTHVILIDGAADPAATPPQLTLADLEKAGTEALAADPELVDRLVADIEPDHLATLIYTSGTTGRPKGVELLHAGWCWEGVAQAELGLLKPDDLQYLWLPLSHSFGKTLICGVIHVGLPTYVDGRIDKLVELLSVVKPTLMCGAPRIFEKVYNRAVTTAQTEGGAKAKIFAWAVAPGARRSRWSRPASRCRRCSASSTASRTGWCSASSRPASAAGSARWSPARRRCPRRSPGSSRRPGCRSRRATA